jgi:hypothetical protein
MGPGEAATARRAFERRQGFQVRLVDLILKLRREHLIFFELTGA